jgi:hypothetical protein
MTKIKAIKASIAATAVSRQIHATGAKGGFGRGTALK